MTTFRLALANLVMWVREQYFPATYAHATWHQLEPFFQLPGHVVREAETVAVELRPFNDHQLICDLVALCGQVNTKEPHLPDGQPSSSGSYHAMQYGAGGQRCAA